MLDEDDSDKSQFYGVMSWLPPFTFTIPSLIERNTLLPD